MWAARKCTGWPLTRTWWHACSAAADDLDRYLQQPRWYQGLGEDAPASIAYFSPEFGITEVLPQYSGGLGILAGDHLKAASDLGVPLIGVGLLYQAGYFKQSLSRDAWQQETYPVIDPDGLPLTLLREPSADGNGKPIQIALPLPNGAAPFGAHLACRRRACPPPAAGFQRPGQ